MSETGQGLKLSEELTSAAFELAPDPSLIVSGEGRLVAANGAAEALFGLGLTMMRRGRLRDALPPDSALAGLMDRAREAGSRMRERGISIAIFGHAPFEADGAVTPLPGDAMLITLQPRGGPVVGDRTADAPGLRSVVGLGRMLAHEIKNPLAGIRGAAQLLKDGATPEDASLAQLIVDETDRIRRLVDRMEAFSEESAPVRDPVNIHRVLDRVRALAVNGVADGLLLREHYDPSLPPTVGDEDMLIQIFLNLVKNAAEAAHARGDGRGEVVITTAYRHGVKIRGASGQLASAAPLEVKIQDNGPGVAPELRDHLFEPFVTTKSFGAGLGLALVAKLVTAHGGMLDFESEPGRTVFRVLLPIESDPTKV